MLQQQQGAQQVHAKHAARVGSWPDQGALWQMAQLQQILQGSDQQRSQMPQCSMSGFSQEAFNSLAQAQALRSLFSHAACSVAPGQASAAPLQPVSHPSADGAGTAPVQSFTGCLPLSTGLPKARKGSGKLRKHTSAAKIARPEAVRTASKPPGRPDAMSIMQLSGQ